MLEEDRQRLLDRTATAMDFNGITLHSTLSVQLKSPAEPETYGTFKLHVPLTTGIQKGGGAEDTHLAELKAASLITPNIKEKKQL